MEITISELQKLIREGVREIHNKTLIENRLEQINRELNALNNPEAWEDAKSEAQNQLRKKTIAFNNMIPRERIMNEGIGENFKMDLKSKLDDALYGWDSENSDFGYLHREKILQGKVSPKQMVDRISKVINDLNTYVEELEYRKNSIKSDIQNPDYEKVWGNLDNKNVDMNESDESKKISLKKLITLAKNAGDIVKDAESELNSLGVAYGERGIPLSRVMQILQNYDIEFDEVNVKRAPEPEKWMSIDDMMNRGLLEKNLNESGGADKITNRKK